MVFSDCTLERLDDIFNLKPLPLAQMPLLQKWLAMPSPISEVDQQYLLKLQRYLQEHVENWNEYELALHFIGPIFALVQFDYERKFSLFGERFLSGVVEGIELSGKPDGLIAMGYREPKKPYFCFQEYISLTFPPDSGGTQGGNGDPQAQVLAAMLVAQEKNECQIPIYGCYVHGRNWYFMALQGKEYATSDVYVATKAEIFDIVRILQALKQIIIERIQAEQV